jgi:hypothetical protein
MGSLANICDSSFLFLNAMFKIFGNQLLLHYKSETRAGVPAERKSPCLIIRLYHPPSPNGFENRYVVHPSAQISFCCARLYCLCYL